MTINKKEYKVNPSGFIFDIKTREMCRSCKRYGTKASCPPHVESIAYYKELFAAFSKARLIIMKFEVQNPAKWKEQGEDSSLQLAKYLIKEREDLMKKGHYYVTIFGGGSCKNCPKCSFPCRLPSQVVTPLEATGINVVESVRKLTGIDIEFPIKNIFYRVGLILWD